MATQPQVHDRPAGHRTGAFTRLPVNLPALAPWIALQLQEERSRWTLWLPVALGAGIALYFSLWFEPPRWLGGLTLLVPLALLAWRRATPAVEQQAFEAPVLIGLAAVALGFTAAQVRTAQVEAPALERRGAYVVEGRLLFVEDRAQGRRLLIGAPHLEGLAAEATPARVRVTVRSAEPELRPGDRVRLRAVLMPPSPPTLPGGFDFARHAYFERLGAVGYALGTAERLSAARQDAAGTALARLRQTIAARITEVVPGTAGAVAAALLTGLRGAIPEQVWSDMQIAGLAHLLAISGLHLGLIAGTLFVASRAALTLIPAVALRVPVKKLAAVFALLGAFGYLLLSGATVPTQRAFIMTALVLLAVLVDRSALSMRTVALAAGVVLLLRPEALLGASFQMSFAAVVALIAVYESGALGLRREGREGRLPRPLLYLAGVALTTLVASAATAPFTAFNFQRLATYGVAANLVAVPLTAFWVMPAGLLGLLLMPFGLDGPWLALMGFGISLVLSVAARVAAWPGAAVLLDQPPTAAVALAALGGLWLCLWRRPWRWLGVAGFAAGLVVAALSRPPDLLIAGGGDLVAARLDQGGLAVAPWRRDAFVTDGWLRHSGQSDPLPWPELGATDSERLRCDALGCIYRKGHRTIAIVRRAEALEEDCARADLVITPLRIDACPGGAPVLGGRELWEAAGVALWLSERGVRLRSVAAERGQRPWVRGD